MQTDNDQRTLVESAHSPSPSPSQPPTILPCSLCSSTGSMAVRARAAAYLADRWCVRGRPASSCSMRRSLAAKALLVSVEGSCTVRHAAVYTAGGRRRSWRRARRSTAVAAASRSSARCTSSVSSCDKHMGTG